MFFFSPFNLFFDQADKYKCVDEVVTICSMLGVDGAIFYRPKDKGRRR